MFSHFLFIKTDRVNEGEEEEEGVWLHGWMDGWMDGERKNVAAMSS